MNFPMYVAYKHSGQPKLEEMSQQELNTLSTFCELHDTETPVFLLRYVCFFCKSGGSFAMTDCFEEHTVLPVLLAQSIIAVVCNLKVNVLM
jgi:ubiquitin carboxyl-terminal hydrolase 34